MVANTDLKRRAFLRRVGIGVGGVGAVTLLPGGGRALAAAIPQQAAGLPPTTDPKDLSQFGFMFPGLPPFRPDADPAVTLDNLAALALSMQDPNATSGDNLDSQSGLTYSGQFIDHDLTLDLEPQPTTFFPQTGDGLLTEDNGTPVNNFETFRFDLSSVYGGGPQVSPQLYAPDGVHFLVQEPNLNGVRDLPRNPNGTAILVEHRNDENEIISQVHTLFVKFHNAIADKLGLGFADTQAMVINHYQWFVLHQFLPAIVGQDVVDGMLNGTIPRFYQPGNPHRCMTPVEWSTAAYRFGHSMVRLAYQVTTSTGKIQVFNLAGNDLHGGRPLPAGRQIDWGQFLTALRRPADNTDAKFNFPRMIDTLISKSLFALPIGGQSGAEPSGSNTLPFRNLVRAFFYGAPSGQDVAAAMGIPVIAPTDAIDPTKVPGFQTGTPLWYYILRESEIGGGRKIGPVGGRIVADVFLGLLQADKNGLLHDQAHPFTPQPPIAPAPGQFELADAAVFAGVAIRP
jgi:hypothetical protein